MEVNIRTYLQDHCINLGLIILEVVQFQGEDHCFLEEPIYRYNMEAPFLEIKMTTSLKYYDTTQSKVTNLMYKLPDLWLALAEG